MTALTIPKPPHGSAEWLAVRWADPLGYKRIPASVAAAIHSEHDYVSSAALAAEMLADTPPEPTPPNAAMARGNALEPSLLAWAGEQLDMVVTTPDVLYVAGRLIATLDGIVGPVEQPLAVVEAKTTMRRFPGTLSRGWYWQGVQQAICANVSTVYWAVLDGNLELHLYTQHVSDDEKGAHTKRCEEWCAAIDFGYYPIWAEHDWESVQVAHPVATVGQVAELHVDDLAVVQALSEVRATIADAKKREEQLKLHLCNVLGDAEVGMLDGRTVVTWKNSTRTSLDTKRLAAEHPDLASEYTTTSTYRRLDIKEK